LSRWVKKETVPLPETFTVPVIMCSPMKPLLDVPAAVPLVAPLVAPCAAPDP
jgi:hypothetical protein